MDDEDMSDDERMQIAGHINFEKNPLPRRKGDEDERASDEDDDETYMQDIIKQQEQAK